MDIQGLVRGRLQTVEIHTLCLGAWQSKLRDHGQYLGARHDRLRTAEMQRLNRGAWPSKLLDHWQVLEQPCCEDHGQILEQSAEMQLLDLGTWLSKLLDHWQILDQSAEDMFTSLLECANKDTQMESKIETLNIKDLLKVFKVLCF